MFRIVLTTLCVAVTATALAQDRTLGVEDMVQALTPAPKTRSLSQAGVTRNLTPVLDLTVNFDFDSARLRDDGRAQLKNLAAALTDARLSSFRFRVEGHTDAQGTASYNDQLSERRAQAVAAYLASEGVKADRLDPLGKGFRELLDPSDPKGAQNRRVRILTLSQ